MKAVLFILILFFAGDVFAANKPKNYRRSEVQKRRDRIMHNGNIENFYPKRFSIDWIVVNNRSYMGVFYNNRRGL